MKHIKLFENWLNEGANIEMDHNDTDPMMDFAQHAWAEYEKLPGKKIVYETLFNKDEEDPYVIEVASVDDGKGADFMISIEFKMGAGPQGVIEAIKVCSDIEEGWEDHDEIVLKSPTPVSAAKIIQQIISRLR